MNFDEISILSDSVQIQEEAIKKNLPGAHNVEDQNKVAFIEASEDVQFDGVFKVIFLGDTAVGKTSLIERFCTNNFNSKQKTTIVGQFHGTSVLTVKNKKIKLKLWDTGGQERFNSIVPMYTRGADAVVLVYDITRKETFKHVRYWLDIIDKNQSLSPAKILIGNKTDVPVSRNSEAVSKEKGERLAEEIGAVFYEASALSGENVQEAHKKIAKLLFKRELKRITKVMEELESSSFNVFDVREEMPTTQSVKTGCNC